MNRIPKDKGPELDMIRFSVHSRRYSQIRAILAEASGESDTTLRMALKSGHGLTWDFKEDPEIFYTEDSQQKDWLRENGIGNPTVMQLIGSSRIFAFTRDEAVRRFREMIEAEGAAIIRLDE